jgi:hypothetical protein
MAKRKPKKTIFIACEGSNTEPLYFENIKEIQEEIDNYPYSLKIYPDKEYDKNPKTDAIGLIKVAIEAKDEYDEVWVVFDKDGYTKHEEAFKLAVDNEVNIAFSSIAFEMWILLHFEKNNTKSKKSAEIIETHFTMNNKYLIDYNKSGDFNVYPLLAEKMEVAYRNAVWLRSFAESDVIHDINPYTNVDRLVKYLFLNEFEYIYMSIGVTTEISGFTITFVQVENEICFKIINNSNKSLVTNSFRFFNEDWESISLENSLVLVGDEVTIPLFQINKYGCIYIEFKNIKIEVDCSL